jgi:DNA-binding PadR family transcriptional regulator
MEKSQLISSRWVMKSGKPPMRFYTITALGQETLEKLRNTLKEINYVLGGKHI